MKVRRSLRRANKTTTSASETFRFELAAGQCRPIPHAGRVSVRCVDGTIWASEAGNSHDIVLPRGDLCVSSGCAKVVLQGLPAGVAEVSPLSAPNHRRISRAFGVLFELPALIRCIVGRWGFGVPIRKS